MADPLSVGVSVLAVVTAAIQSTKSLSAAVKRYKDRDTTLKRLQDELEDLINVLSSLEGSMNSETPILALLKRPIHRCSQVCREFEEAMEVFSRKSKTGLRDWARMEFMRDDINGFMDTLAGYKSTIMVSLGTITMHHSKISRQVLEDYSEVIKDTAYKLEIRLQRIEAHITIDSTTSSVDASIDLQDERDVTRQCLRICQDARSYIESLQDRQPSLLREATPSTADTTVRNRFDAELMTSQTLNENRDKIAATIGRLQERLESLLSNEGPGRSSERLRLQEDIDISRQCLEVCNEASKQVSYQKIHAFGEIAADDDTDQVVVTTIADLFDVRKVLAKSRSTQLVGSLKDETLQKLSADRYSSRFGAISGDLGRAQADVVSPPVGARPPNPTRDSQPAQSRPSPNEVRKRAAEHESGI